MSVVVLGGGLSGLVVAHALESRGEEVRVVEARSRVGGLIRSRLDRGFLTESGPNGFLDKEPAMRRLIAEVGLTSQLRIAEAAVKRRYIFVRGRVRELPSAPPKFLGSGVISLGAKLRVLLEPFSGRAKGDESVHHFFRRHLGNEIAQTLADVAQIGTYAGDSRQLSMEAAFPQLVAMERRHRSLFSAVRAQAKAAKAPRKSPPLCTFRSGMEALPEAIAAHLRGKVMLETEVLSLEAKGATWRIQVRSKGKVERLETERVVMTFPTHVAAKLLRPLDEALAAELGAISYAPISVVHLGFRANEVAHPLDGFGLLAPDVERRKVLGAIFASSVFPFRAPPDHVLLSCLVGGARHPELAELDDARLITMCRAELAVMLGARGEPVLGQVQRWPLAIPQYNVGHLERLSRIEKLVQHQPGLSLLGNAYFGVGVNDCVREAFSLADRLCQ